MGTNYYFQPRGLSKIDKINDNLSNSIKIMGDEYKKLIKSILEEYKPLYKEYESILSLPDLDNLYFGSSTIEVPDIHICKISVGWKPLFQANSLIRTFDDLENFYNKHRGDLLFLNEYGESVDWEEFKRGILDLSNDLTRKSHLGYKSVSGPNYYIDNRNIEWTDFDFA